MIIQLTGLSGSGKTTISASLKQKIMLSGLNVEIIDGDCYRAHLCKDLGFSKEDRYENIRRLGKVAHELSDKGNVAIISAINPYEEVRVELKEKYGALIVHVNCELQTLLNRDTKGLYFKALLPEGHPQKLIHFTGISDPFEIPLKPDLILNTHEETLEVSVSKLERFVLSR